MKDFLSKVNGLVHRAEHVLTGVVVGSVAFEVHAIEVVGSAALLFVIAVAVLSEEVV